MGEYRVVSSDNHIFEPPDLWTSRIESKYKARCPQLKSFDSGGFQGGAGQLWVCDDRTSMAIGQGSNVGKRFDDPDTVRNMGYFEEVRPGGYLPEEYVKDLDLDGVDAGIIYPSVGFILYQNVRDSLLFDAVCSVYNDWLAEFCSYNPKRLVGAAMINLDDLQVGLKEIERCANMGFRAAMITLYPPVGRRYNAPEYEPLWALAQDLDMPLSLHAASNRWGSGEDFQGPVNVTLSMVINMDHGVRMSLSDIIMSGVFERYSKLQVGTVEHELSWIPHFLDRMDFNYTQRGTDIVAYKFKEDMMPSDYFRRNVFCSFQEDSLGIRMRDLIGVNTLQWGSDYPHIESTFPNSQQVLDEILSDCADDERALIVGGNSARVYKV